MFSLPDELLDCEHRCTRNTTGCPLEGKYYIQELFKHPIFMYMHNKYLHITNSEAGIWNCI